MITFLLDPSFELGFIGKSHFKNLICERQSINWQTWWATHYKEFELQCKKVPILEITEMFLNMAISINVPGAHFAPATLSPFGS